MMEQKQPRCMKQGPLKSTIMDRHVVLRHRMPHKHKTILKHYSIVIIIAAAVIFFIIPIRHFRHSCDAADRA
jgi:hypothetical protein